MTLRPPETPEMDLSRFAALTDAYGAAPGRWPAGERADAEAFLAQSADARRLRDQAAQIDTMLGRVRAPAASDALHARLTRAMAQRQAPRAGLLLWFTSGRLVRPLMLTGMAVLGLYLGMASSPMTAVAEDDAVEFEVVAGGSAPGGLVDFLEMAE